jgi:hypothetical protein
MKKNVVVLLLIAVNSCAFSQNWTPYGEEILSPFPSPYAMTLLNEEQLKFSWYSPEAHDANYDREITIPYSLTSIAGLQYLELVEPIPNEMALGFFPELPRQNYGSKVLLLMGIDTSTLQNLSTGEQYYPKYVIGFSWNENSFGSHILLRDFFNFEATSRVYRESSSTLIENGIPYSIANLSNIESDTPWVEGVVGDGIGESFIIENSWGSVMPYILIMNGFISADRPHLYFQNGRIKEIKIESLTTGNYVIREVLDTPNPQTIDIKELQADDDLKITILDVFRGSKYSDTAIHLFVTFNREVIPVSFHQASD